MRLLSLDRTQYREGDPFIADIELLATDTVVIPWSAESDAVDPKRDYQAPGFRYMMLYLADAKDMGLETTGHAMGSQLVPESLKTLKVGDRVRIRVGGRWKFVAGGPSQVGPGTIPVWTVLSPVNEGGRVQLSIRSRNAVRVLIDR